MAITTTAEAKKFVLKAYKTEANARANENPLLMTSPLSSSGSIIDNESQASTYGFWAFQRYWYRIEANEPVNEFHIDWDDGENNSPKKANVSIIKNDNPSFVGIVSHIYTQSKNFYPLIRVKSVEGYLSKWYTPYATTNSFDGLDDDIKTDGYDKGQNDFSIVSMERNDNSLSYARIPILKPANVSPVGVLKTDRKRAFAGIDNDWLGHNSRVLYSDSTEMPYSDTLYAFCSNPNRTTTDVKVTYQEGRLGGTSSKTQFYVDVGEGSYSAGGNQGYTAADLEDKVIYIRTMDEIYGYYIAWSTANTSPPDVTSVSGAVATAVPISTAQSTQGGATYLAASDLVTRLVAVMEAQTYHSRDEFSVTSALIDEGATESFTIGMGTESPSAGSFTGSNETSSTSATTADDGLTTYDTGGNTYGNYFTFEATGYGNYYIWFKQAAKGEVFSIAVDNSGSGQAAFSGSNEISSTAVATADDGLSTAISSGERYGNYFTFSSTTVNYYAWMRQAAKKEMTEFTINTALETALNTKYVVLYDKDGSSYAFWFTTSLGGSTPVGFTYTKEVVITGAANADAIATLLEAAIEAGGFIRSADAAVISTDPWTASVSGTRVNAELNVAGLATDSTTNSSDIAVSTTTQGKNLGLDPAGKESSLSGKTAVPVDYDDGDSATDMATEIRSDLGAISGVTTGGSGTTVTVTLGVGGFVTGVAEGTSSSSTDTLNLETGFGFSVTTDGKAESLNPSGKHSSLSGITSIGIPYTDGVSKATIATAIYDELQQPLNGKATVTTAGSGDSTTVSIAFIAEGNVADGIDGSYDGSDSEASIDLSTGFVFTTSQGDADRYKIIATNTNTGLVSAPTQSGAAHPFSTLSLLTAGTSHSDGSIKQKTLRCTNALHNDAKLVNVVKVLKVELVKNLEATDSYGGSTVTDRLYPGERVYLQAGLNQAAANLLPTEAQRDANPNLSGTICSVSLGNPIIEENSIGTRITVDATESKVRCSNKSISYYYIDDNKLISGDTSGNTADNQAVDSTNNITDKLVNGADFRSTLGTKDLRYSFDWWRDHQDSNYRYYSTKRLVRAQIKDNHTSVTDDGFNTSPIVHWDSSSYLATNTTASNGQPSEISKWNYGSFLFTNSAKLRTPNWYNLNVTNRGDRTPIFGSDAALTHTLNDSTAFDDVSTEEHYAPDNVSASDETPPSGDTVGPRNALFMARKDKFDRIFVRVSHDRLNAAALTIANLASDITPGTTTAWPKIRIQAMYPANKTRDSSTIVWKALPIVDRTKIRRKDDSSFYNSGEIMFIPPTDWVKTSHSANIEYPYEDNFFDDYDTGTDGISDGWTEDSYAIIFLITQIKQGPEVAKSVFNVMSIHPYNNAHSQLIEIEDPMHVSLNKYGIAQSVAFTRKGKYQQIKDRSGISQMRRVGAEGGNIKLGGIDLKSDAQTTRAKFYEFQNDSTPVYYDVTHKDNSITRLFGVMTDMSEDHPTGGVIPKFACSLVVTYILEIDSSGNITGDGYRPLGGDIIDAQQYLSAS
jgi:hypothetical protein